MAEKFLNIIQKFTQDDLLKFLHRNGHGDLEEIISTGEVTNGEKFLNLDELQIIKWKLPLNTRKRLMSFVEQVKTNPQNFLDQTEMNKHLERRQSLRIKNKISDRLQISIILPKPVEIPKKPTVLQTESSPTERPLPTSSEENSPVVPLPEKLSTVSSMQRSISVPPINKPSHPIRERPRAPTPELKLFVEEVLSPVDEPSDYLDMNRENIKDSEARYDTSGYLIPIEKLNIDENAYELCPTEKVISRFSLHPPISERAPLALPRKSTDDRGYIPGPEVPKNSSISNLSIASSKTENDEEDVAYEPVDYFEDNTSPNLPTRESSSQFSRFIGNFGLRKKCRKNDESESDTKSKASSTESLSSPKIFLRPLPPLPTEENRCKTLPKPKLKTPVEEEQKEYINFNPLIQSCEKLAPPDLSLKPNTKHTRSKSESNLDDSASYDNILNNVRRLATPEVTNAVTGKTGKQALPLPPNTIPQLSITDGLPHSMSEEVNLFEDINEANKTNLFDEPFYRYTDRKGAKMLLTDLDTGAFLFRPSKRFHLTLSLKHNGEYYNLGISKTAKNGLRLNTSGSNMSPEFETLTDFVEYFTTDKLTFEHQGQVIETLLVKSLPPNRF